MTADHKEHFVIKISDLAASRGTSSRNNETEHIEDRETNQRSEQ